jgi:hypothetical protein
MSMRRPELYDRSTICPSFSPSGDHIRNTMSRGTMTSSPFATMGNAQMGLCTLVDCRCEIPQVNGVAMLLAMVTAPGLPPVSTTSPLRSAPVTCSTCPVVTGYENAG